MRSSRSWIAWASSALWCARPLAYWPSTVSGMVTCRVRRSHCCDLLPSEPCVRVAPHTAQASAVGKRSPAARSIRSWFRLTGGFRHPSFGPFSLRRLTSPSVEAPSFIAPLRPAGSLHPFRLGIPAVAALSPPLQRSLRFLRHPLPRRLLPCGWDTVASQRRDERGLPC